MFSLYEVFEVKFIHWSLMIIIHTLVTNNNNNNNNNNSYIGHLSSPLACLSHYQDFSWWTSFSGIIICGTVLKLFFFFALLKRVQGTGGGIRGWCCARGTINPCSWAARNRLCESTSLLPLVMVSILAVKGNFVT